MEDLEEFFQSPIDYALFNAPATPQHESSGYMQLDPMKYQSEIKSDPFLAYGNGTSLMDNTFPSLGPSTDMASRYSLTSLDSLTDDSRRLSMTSSSNDGSPEKLFGDQLFASCTSSDDYAVGHELTEETGGRDFPCSQCEKSFDKKWRLRSHVSYVHEQRRFVCGECDKKFRSDYDLRRHSTTHTGQRFVCDVCNTGFASKQRVADHIRRSIVCWDRKT